MSTAVSAEKKTISVIIIEDFKLTRVGLRCALNSNEDIKVVAEKGMKTADKERLAQKMKATQEKIASQPQPQQKQEKADTGREPGDD